MLVIQIKRVERRKEFLIIVKLKKGEGRKLFLQNKKIKGRKEEEPQRGRITYGIGGHSKWVSLYYGLPTVYKNGHNITF